MAFAVQLFATYVPLGWLLYYLIEGTFAIKKEKISLWFSSLVSVNVFTLWLVRFLLHDSEVLVSTRYVQGAFWLQYMMMGLIVAFLLASVVHTCRKWERRTPAVSQSKWKRLLLTIIFAIGVFGVIFALWFVDYFGSLTPEQFLFNLSSPVKGTAQGANQHIYSTVVVSAIVATLIFYYSLTHPFVIKLRHKTYYAWEHYVSKWWQVTAMTCAIAILSISFIVWKLQLVAVGKAYFNESTYIADNYVPLSSANVKFPDKKRNLIHIYLESVENSYFDRENGGYMDTNLMPELLELSKEGISFSHNDKMGGPHQTYGTSWSVASMVNMMNGIPLKIAMGGNDYGKSGYFLPGVYGLGDLLADNGYEQTIMFGADADFGGLTTYFTSHGNFNIWDLKYARQEGFIPKDYNVWWGFEDDKLFEFAKEEITRLHQTGKPFNFTMETADTHFPDGYLSKKADQKFDMQYANVIAYSSQETLKFVRWIQAQPFYKDTVVVITGDHLSMDKHFFKKFDPAYERTVYNLFLNSSVTTSNTKNRQYATEDFYPTIVASMGIEVSGNRLGLGTNLFSGDATLIERDGLATFEDELSKNSNFYNTQFVDEKQQQ